MSSIAETSWFERMIEVCGLRIDWLNSIGTFRFLDLVRLVLPNANIISSLQITGFLLSLLAQHRFVMFGEKKFTFFSALMIPPNWMIGSCLSYYTIHLCIRQFLLYRNILYTFMDQTKVLPKLLFFHR